MMDDKTVTITKSEYEGLKEACDFLDCLTAMGVDNWVGYEEAQQMWREQQVV